MKVRELLKGFHKTRYGQVRAIKLGLAAHLGIHPDSTAAHLMPWIVSQAVCTVNRYLIRQDGETSYERVFNKAHSGPLVHFGERVLAHHQAAPPAQKLHLRSQPQKHYSSWLGKVSSQECTSLLMKVRFSNPEQSLVWSEISNSILSSSIRSFFPLMNPNLTIKNLKKIGLLFRNCSGHSSCNSSQRCRSETSSAQISVLRSLLSMQIRSSRLHQPKERIENHHHCQQHRQQPHHNQQSFLNPQVFRYVREFRFNLSNLSNQVLVSLRLLSKHLRFSLNNQFRSEEEPEQSQDLRILQRLQRCLRTSRKIIFLLVKIRSMQMIRKLNQRRVAFSGMVSRGSSGILNRSDQGSNHKRAQVDRSSWS